MTNSQHVDFSLPFPSTIKMSCSQYLWYGAGHSTSQWWNREYLQCPAVVVVWEQHNKRCSHTHKVIFSRIWGMDLCEVPTRSPKQLFRDCSLKMSTIYIPHWTSFVFSPDGRKRCQFVQASLDHTQCSVHHYNYCCYYYAFCTFLFLLSFLCHFTLYLMLVSLRLLFNWTALTLLFSISCMQVIYRKVGLLSACAYHSRW